MELLNSKDECAKEAALLAIYSLGNTKLAIDIASSYRTKGSLFALARIASMVDSSLIFYTINPLLDAMTDSDPLIREAAIKS